MCNCNEEINKKCPNRICAYCDWHLKLQAKEQECEELNKQLDEIEVLAKNDIKLKYNDKKFTIISILEPLYCYQYKPRKRKIKY